MKITKKLTIINLLVSLIFSGYIIRDFYNSSQFRANAETLVTKTLDTTLFTSTIFGTGTYGTGVPERTTTLDGVTYGGKAITTSPLNTPTSGSASRYIQAQANNGIIYNTTSLPGRITSIQTVQVGTARNHTLYLGNVRLVSSTAGDFTTLGATQGTKTTATSLWNVASGENHYFFSIKRGASAAYFQTISITYDTDVPPSEEVAVSSVSISLASSSINSGTTTQATATVLPENATNKSVSWTSSNTSVATINVSTGLITANSTGIAGTTTITATSVADGTKQGTATLTVNPVIITSLSVNLQSASIGIGGSTNASATILPANASNKTIAWTSSDEGVATVNSSGVVSAVSAGTANIIATSQDGSNITGSTGITITEPVLVTGVSVTLNPSNIIVGSTSQATATIEPPNANTQTVTWTSDDEAVATINSSGLITALSVGTTVITAIANDDGVVQGTATLIVRGPSNTIIINEVYGGGGNSLAPFTHDFVELYNLSSAPISLNSFSIQYTSSEGTTWTNKVNLSGTILAQGYYLIQLSSGGAVGSALPTPDITGSINMAGTAGKVALVNSTTALIGANPVSDITVVDFVGFGTANAFEGTGATIAPSNTQSVSRKTLSDTNSNLNDFEVTDPSPKNSLQGFTEQFLAQTTNKQGSCNAEDLNWNFLSNNFDSLSGVNQTAFSTPGSYQFGVDALERYTYLINQVDGLPDFEDSLGNPIPKLSASRISTLNHQTSNGTNGLYLFVMAGFSLFFFSLYLKKRSFIK